MITLEQEMRLRELMKAFLEENAKINLSAFRTEEACWIGNILDSVAFLDLLPKLPRSNSPLTILDMGTGGGFPLLPLAICLPEARCTGLDATRKKIDAVTRITAAVGLDNVQLLCGRAENIGHDKAHREQYDIVCARAITEIPPLLEYCSVFTKVRGKIVLWKSLTIDDELKRGEHAATLLGCKRILQHRYTMPGDFGERQLIVYEKIRRISNEFPREVGVPEKKPL